MAFHNTFLSEDENVSPLYSAHVKVFGFCILKTKQKIACGILIPWSWNRVSAHGIQNSTRGKNSIDRKSGIQCMEYGIHRLESRIEDWIRKGGLYELYTSIFAFTYPKTILISVFRATDLFYLS